MYEVPDHPDITYIQRTGLRPYEEPEVRICEQCLKDLDGETVYCDEDYEYLCKRCLLHLHERDWSKWR